MPKDKIPYIGFGNDTLDTLPILKIGDKVKCPRCKKYHVVIGAKDKDGNETDMFLSYQCGKSYYMAGINGKSTMGRKPDVSGSI